MQSIKTTISEDELFSKKPPDIDLGVKRPEFKNFTLNMFKPAHFLLIVLAI